MVVGQYNLRKILIIINIPTLRDARPGIFLATAGFFVGAGMLTAFRNAVFIQSTYFNYWHSICFNHTEGDELKA